jgi:DNA-directed RNA polymerase subunit RPC12/RpoP
VAFENPTLRPGIAMLIPRILAFPLAMGTSQDIMNGGVYIWRPQSKWGAVVPIRISCSACGKKLKVKDEYAGRQSKCPACGWGIIVPLESERESDGIAVEPNTMVPPAVPEVAASLAMPAADTAVQVAGRIGDGTGRKTERASGRPVGKLVAIGAAGFVVGAVLGSAITLAVATSKLDKQPGTEPPSGSRAAVAPQRPSPTDPAESRYRVLTADIGRAIAEEWGKDVFEVRLSRKVSKTALKEIAREIESSKPPNPRTGIKNRRTVVGFYLPEVDAYGLDGSFGSRWALADLNGPVLTNGEDVAIFGFTIDEEIKAVAKRPVPTGNLIGEWIDDTNKSFYFIYQRDGLLYISRGFKSEQELVGFGPEPFRLYERKERSSAGEYYRINDSGNLELRDNEGLAVVARRVR